MVHFVGAGPGAVDLITLRGARLLQQADTVIYAGSLVNKKLLDDCREGCELYDSAFMDLDEIVEVIKSAHDRGRETVRLDSGDPSIYGAINEVMERLEELDIPYDVCPGVSSFTAAAAALKTEYMVPEKSQSLVITRMSGRTKVPAGESLRSFAAHGCAISIFLSMSLIDEVQRELTEGGFKPDAPAAIVYRASHEDEKIFRCTVGDLAKTAKDNSITKTALIIVGKMLEERGLRSKLYDTDFSTEYRK